MKCPRRPAELAEYAQGIVSQDVAASIAVHVNDCPICSSEVRELEAIFAAMKSRKVQAPPDGYWTTLLPRIHERLDESAGVSRFLKGAPVLLPAAVVMILIIFVTHFNTFVPLYDAQEIHAIIHQMADDMLQEVDQNASVEESAGAGRLSAAMDESAGTDREILRAIFEDGEGTEGYSEIDQVQPESVITDDEESELVVRLQKNI